MTTNQLIALLETYATGDSGRTGLAYLDSEDVKYLRRRKLIAHNAERWLVTDRGRAMVETLLFSLRESA